MGREPYPGPKPFRDFGAHYRYVRGQGDDRYVLPDLPLIFGFLSWVGITPLFWWVSHRFD
jgi:hypothetical protein